MLYIEKAICIDRKLSGIIDLEDGVFITFPLHLHRYGNQEEKRKQFAEELLSVIRKWNGGPRRIISEERTSLKDRPFLC
jgi:hypothetical protein